MRIKLFQRKEKEKVILLSVTTGASTPRAAVLRQQLNRGVTSPSDPWGVSPPFPLL